MTTHIEEQYMQDIAKDIIAQNASIMVGAGFSKNARYNGAKNNKMLSWYELADKFYEVLYDSKLDDEKKYLNPISLAEEVEIMYGRKKLNDIIIESLPDLEHFPSKVHYDLLNLGWKDIFTTNYDTLLERASKEIVNSDYLVVNNKEDLIQSAGNPRIIKLHGSFPSHVPFIITEEDYRKYPKQYAPFVNTVQQALLENNFCMIGFSGTDPNFLNWIGWLSDNYNNVLPQQIYLISVSGESEVQKERLRSKNIVVLDLNKIWPDKNKEERISKFFLHIDDIINKEKDKIKWIDRNSLEELSKHLSEPDNINKDILDYCIKFIKERIELYPGWIALPERYKNISSCMLRELEDVLFKIKNTDIDIVTKIEYIHEYVKFKNVCNRPIFREEIDTIKDILMEVKCHNKDKVNLINIMLLRTYREFGLKEDFELLKLDIDEKDLSEYYINFLKYEECMMELHSLNISGYKEKVLKWDVDKYDYYWMLMKVSLLIKFEDYEICKAILTNTIKSLRRIKYKSMDTELIKNQSLEDCFVKFINHINQAITPFWSEGNEQENEETKIKNNELSKNGFDWFEEDKLYKRSFNFKYTEEPVSNSTLLFDLGYISRGFSYKNENKTITDALEYLRFREITGTPFLIGNITSKEGIVEVVRRISHYNPSLAFITCMKSNENKGIEHIYSRKFLNQISRSDADRECKNLLDLINNYLLKEIDQDNRFFSKNIYDYFACLLPEIISRLIIKCSIDMRDEVLKTSLNIYSSDKIKSFKNMDKLIKRLIKTYTDIEIIDRIFSVLEFPIINSNGTNEYPDPIIYFNINKNFKKMKLDNEQYDMVMKQLFINNKIEKSKVEIRLIHLYFIIEFTDEDAERLEDLIWSNYDESELPEIPGFYKSILMKLPYSRYINKEKLKTELINEAIRGLENEKKRFEGGTKTLKFNSYSELNMVENLIVDNIFSYSELQNIFELILKISINYKAEFKKTQSFSFMGGNDQWKNKIKDCENILINMLLEYYKDGFNNEENGYVKEFLKIFSDEKINFSSLEIIYNILLNKDYNDVIHLVQDGALYNEDDQFMEVIRTLNILIKKDFIKIPENIKNSWLEIILNRICISLINDGSNVIRHLSYIVKNLSAKDIENISRYLIVLLEKSLDCIVIEYYDDEQEVIRKVTYKKEVSKLASVLYYETNIENTKLKELIQKWKSICEDDNEFIEVVRYWIR